MEWQPIETAPLGERVVCGYWHIGDKFQQWNQTTDVARERLFGFLWPVQSSYYTHWKPLPPPPTEADNG